MKVAQIPEAIPAPVPEAEDEDTETLPLVKNYRMMPHLLEVVIIRLEVTLVSNRG